MVGISARFLHRSAVSREHWVRRSGAHEDGRRWANAQMEDIRCDQIRRRQCVFKPFAYSWSRSRGWQPQRSRRLKATPNDLVADVEGNSYDARVMKRMGVLTCRFDLYGTSSGPFLDADLWLLDPSGATVASTYGGTYSSALHVSLSYDLPDSSPGGTYTCRVDANANAQTVANASAQYLVATPTSVSTVSDFYLYQSFNDYARRRVYQTLTGGGYWQYRYGSISDIYSSWLTNTCNLSNIVTGGGETNSSGQFEDVYSMSGAPNCPSNPSCESSATQTILIGGHQVLQHTVTYRCGQVDMP